MRNALQLLSAIGFESKLPQNAAGYTHTAYKKFLNTPL